MGTALAAEQAQQLRTRLDKVLASMPELSDTARAAFGSLVEVLESNSDAVVFAADATISTQQAAALLGVSRMTVVRLIDRGDLTAEAGAVHRRISVTELARYQRDADTRRRSALADLAQDLDEDTPPDEVVSTR